MRAVAESSLGERAGTPAQLEQLLGAHEREQARGLPAREHRREERRAVGPLEPLRPRAGRLDGAEAFPIGPEPEDAEHAELALGGVDEAAVHRLGRVVVDDPRPHLPVEQLGVERPRRLVEARARTGAGGASRAASRSAEIGSVSAPAFHSR